MLCIIFPCFVSGNLYGRNSLPMPSINPLNTPYERTADLKREIRFDASTSYDPDGNAIAEWKWDFYKYNGTDWDYLYTFNGPDKALITHKFSETGYYKVRLWVRDSSGGENDCWNHIDDVKEAFVLIIDVKIQCNEYMAVGSGNTFTYTIGIPKEIQVRGIYIGMIDDNGQEIFAKWISKPIIGQESKFEWDGKANQGPNAGNFVNAGKYQVKLMVIPFRL